jgi:hypothetical protein
VCKGNGELQKEVKIKECPCKPVPSRNRVRLWQSGEKIVIASNHSDCPFDSISHESLRRELLIANCITEGSTLLTDRHGLLLLGDHPLKRMKTICSTNELIYNNCFLKVKVASVIIFTDDTSGNRSKQFNPFESW